jgi:monothiol glutaredoxin
MAALTPELKTRFDQETSQHRVVLYMKGNKLFPRCGFSANALAALQAAGAADVYTVDVLAEPDVREAIKEYSGWPTLPQAFIGGQLVGGSDIVRDLAESGELAKLVKG